MDREQIARSNRNSGASCAAAVYAAFSDRAGGSVPIPRSEGGKCGALLAAEKVLRQAGVDIADLDARFTQQFGSQKCWQLRLARHSCNDLVGAAARLTAEALGESQE